MGMYNLKGQFEIGNSKLRKGVCPICDNPGINSIIDGGDRDSFDYVCKNCNPKLIISISGSVLMSSDYFDELDKNPKAKSELKTDIEKYKGKYYPLISDNIGFFLGENYSSEGRVYNFQDWLDGKMGGRPNEYKGLSKEELVKINSEQKRIYEMEVENRLNKLTKDFDERKVKSIDPKEFLTTEVETIKNLLYQERLRNDFVAMNEYIDLDNWSKKLLEIKSIQNFYQKAIKGEVDYNDIVSPNQKIRVGSMVATMHFMIESLAYKKHLDNLKNELSRQEQKNKKKDSLSDIQFQIRDISAPTQIQLNSDYSSLSQKVNYKNDDVFKLFKVLKSDLKTIDNDIKEDIIVEIDNATKQLSNSKNIDSRLITIGSLIKDIGISTFVNLVSSPVFELMKPHLGL